MRTWTTRTIANNGDVGAVLRNHWLRPDAAFPSHGHLHQRRPSYNSSSHGSSLTACPPAPSTLRLVPSHLALQLADNGASHAPYRGASWHTTHHSRYTHSVHCTYWRQNELELECQEKNEGGPLPFTLAHSLHRSVQFAVRFWCDWTRNTVDVVTVMPVHSVCFDCSVLCFHCQKPLSKEAEWNRSLRPRPPEETINTHNSYFSILHWERWCQRSRASTSSR